MDITNIRKQFPIYENIPNLVYLDSGATALKPKCVLDKMNEYYSSYGVNIHRGVYSLSYQATDEYDKAREIVAKFINAKTNEVVYTKGASNGLNLVAMSYGMENINEGDEIIVSELEHHSNLLPWQHIAKVKNATLKYIELDSTGRITMEAFKKSIIRKNQSCRNNICF